MKSTEYSEKVMDHFRNPRNSGELKGENVAMGRVGNPVCGDLMEVYIDVEDDKISDVKFKTFGCGSAIATASMVTEMAKGKTIEEASAITRNDVAEELDGLPPIKMHCSNLAADALKDAIKKYHEKKNPSTKETVITEKQRHEIKGEKEFEGKGVLYMIDDLAALKDKRIMVLENGDMTVETALNLSEYTPRVVFVTAEKEIHADSELKKRLKQSDVKVLYESELLEISGFKEVEKVMVHDLNEDEKYELFIDAIIIQ
jgi:nitrogen fixation NifU-like protein